jgi:uncharacterized membrane protein
VLLMIAAHTFDAWTHPTERAALGFRLAMFFGGFAAPLFLWLSGVGIALSVVNTDRRTGDQRAAVEHVVRRGLEIFVLAFLFRLQAFVASPGSHPITLFRVDILNIMGPAVAIAGAIWGLSASNTARAVTYGALACAFSMATPVVRTSTLVDALPTWLAWYVRPAGEHTMFTAFPWVGFVFAGVACGVLLASAREPASHWRVHSGLAAAGLALFGFGLWTSYFPSIYTQSSFWTSSPTYFAIRVGLLMMALSGMYALSRAAHPRQLLEPLGRLGRNSLFVYWIHVELVYGYPSWAIRRSLPVWGAAMAFVTFCLLIYGSVVVRDRIVDAWRARKGRVTERAWAYEWQGPKGCSQPAARFLGQTANLRDEPLS